LHTLVVEAVELEVQHLLLELVELVEVELEEKLQLTELLELQTLVEVEEDLCVVLREQMVDQEL
jgi:hypothetical protein